MDSLEERSTAIRARFHAMGLSQQATQAFTEQQLDQAKGFYQRAVASLDPALLTAEARRYRPLYA